MSHDRSRSWRTGLAALAAGAFLLGLAAAGSARGASAEELAVGAGLAGVGLAGPADGASRAWWSWPLTALARGCLMAGGWILVSAAMGWWAGDLLGALLVGLVTGVAVTAWELVGEDGPWHRRFRAWLDRERSVRSQDEFGPIRGRIQAWWDREPYRGAGRAAGDRRDLS